MPKICPKCEKSVRFIQVVKKDKKTKKHWLVEKCAKCGFNRDIEELNDKK